MTTASTEKKQPIVTAESNLNGKTDRKAREPKTKANYDQVLAQISGLDFNERVDLARALKSMIHSELSDMQAKATKATEDVKDLNL